MKSFIEDIKYGLMFAAFLFVIITMWEVQQTLPV